MRKPQLFLLHFAGGNSYSFQFLNQLLKDFDVIPLELPGRGKRTNEQLLRNFDLAASDIYRQIINRLTTSQYLVYGHSMGAFLALRVSSMLETRGKSPTYVIVSGNPGPGIEDNDPPKKRYLLEKNDFISELKTLGGVPNELFDHEDLFRFYEPILRADFEISENSEMSNEPPIKAPLYALMGNQEHKVEEISNWARFTKSSFKYQILEGGHFFILDHPQKIAEIIKSCFFLEINYRFK
jgi:external thioesterase TEII